MMLAGDIVVAADNLPVLPNGGQTRDCTSRGAPASDELIAKVVTAINENYKVEYIAQGDCTGEPEFPLL